MKRRKQVKTNEGGLHFLPKRKEMGDPGDVGGGFKGPWAGFVGEQEGKLYGASAEEKVKLQEAKAEKHIQKHTKDLPWIGPGQERSIFHGKSEQDFMGRTYLHIPTTITSQGMLDLAKADYIPECFVPKKGIHIWTGHNKAVTCMELFPESGHLLLSGSMDAKIKIWNTYGDRRVLRTFIGHNKAVRNVSFNPDGTRFASASYDQYVKYWDTETGSCQWQYKVKALPHCLKVYPEDPRILLVGCADHRIYQLDTRLKEEEAMVLEYNEHLDAINTITLINSNRRMITTSDDKSIRFWEFGIPVTIKMIAEPHMHAITSVAVHPNGKVFAAQSQDNQILTYTTGGSVKEAASDDQPAGECGERFKLYKKRFAGHITAGYACQLGFSPDGQFVMSGDSAGKLWFWNWKTGKIIKNFKAHDKVLIAAQWLPKETSKIVTASWDNTLKLWD